MISAPGAARIWIATGPADMRRGMPGLALLVQEHFKRDPFAGDVFVLRGRGGALIKCLWHDGWGCRSMPSGWTVAASSGRRRTRGDFADEVASGVPCGRCGLARSASDLEACGGRIKGCGFLHFGAPQAALFMILWRHGRGPAAIAGGVRRAARGARRGRRAGSSERSGARRRPCDGVGRQGADRPPEHPDRQAGAPALRPTLRAPSPADQPDGTEA